MNVQDIKIKDIVITQNSRAEMKGLHELMEDIKQHGLIHPIHVGKGAGGKYIFESGRRRLLACEKLGFATIPAIVGEEKKYKDLLLHNLRENVQRQDLTVTELGRICTELKDNNMNEREIAAALSLAYTKIKSALDAYQGVPARLRKKITFLDKRNKVNKGFLSAAAANQIVNIRRKYKLKQEDFEKLFETAIEENMSLQDARTVAALMKTGLSTAQALKEKDKFKDYVITIVADEDEVIALAKRHDITPSALFVKILYGEIKETLKRPKFAVFAK